MANGGIIGPVNDPTRGDRITTTFTSSGTYTRSRIWSSSSRLFSSSWRWRWWRIQMVIAGGGGAGGYRTSFPGGTKLTIPSSPVSVTVGGGGASSISMYNQQELQEVIKFLQYFPNNHINRRWCRKWK
jgi:hypothetical protein